MWMYMIVLQSFNSQKAAQTASELLDSAQFSQVVELLG
jgi:hypothetical protein